MAHTGITPGTGPSRRALLGAAGGLAVAGPGRGDPLRARAGGRAGPRGAARDRVETVYGRRVVAVGADAEAARRAGMPARRVVASTDVLTGVAAAAAGLIVAARPGPGSSNAAAGCELDVIAAVVLGGTSPTGGSASVLGAVLGALAVAVIGKGPILCHVSPFLTGIVTGAIPLAAVWLNARAFGRLGASRGRRA